MGRQTLIRDADGIYHVTSRCNNREWFSLPMEFVWHIFDRNIGPLSERYETEIHTFVLMANHFHLLLSAPLLNLDRFMRDFMTTISKKIARGSKRINHVFGARYKWSLVTNPFDAAIVYKYVCRNPVRAGICDRVEQYAYSTIMCIFDNRCTIPIVERIDPIGSFARVPVETRLQWLNLPAPHEHELLIRNGLRRFEFKLSESNSVRKKVNALRATYVPQHPTFDRYLLGPEVE